MSFPRCIAVFTFLINVAFALQSQDLKPSLRPLNPGQKLEVLEYMRSKGADVDREIQALFDQMPAAEKEKIRMFIDLLGNAEHAMQRTVADWDHDTISFGKIEEGTILLDSFTVKNTGNYPYLIARTQTSCDCTVLHYPRFPVMPGESAVVRVEFDSANKIGKTRAGIVLYDNSTPNLRTVLYLDGTITPRKGSGKSPLD